MNKSSYIDKNIKQLIYDLHKDVKSYIAYLPIDILNIVINNVYEYIPLIRICEYEQLIKYFNKYNNTIYHNIKVNSVKQTRIFLVKILHRYNLSMSLHIINQNDMMNLQFGSVNLTIRSEQNVYSFREDYIQIQPVFIESESELNYNLFSAYF